MSSNSDLEILEIILRQGQTTREIALQCFDRLEPVDLAFLIGRWQGTGLHTGHRWDGLLEAAGWYGKEFIAPDQVHPLLFQDAQGQLFKIAPPPTWVNLGLQLPFSPTSLPLLIPGIRVLLPLFKTESSQAQIHMIDYRGQTSAAMSYNTLPIYDVFRQIDGQTVMGVMNCQAMPELFFFILTRDSNKTHPSEFSP